MTFQPRVADTVRIGGVAYRVTAHPSAPSMPYAQEGRQATVYQLVVDAETNDAGALRALKVMKPRYRLPSLVAQAERLAAFADIPGLDVCRRHVVTAQTDDAALDEYPDLQYAVLMPWVAGPTWMETLLYQQTLSSAQCLTLATALARLLVRMEALGVAHGDLSGPNVLLPTLAAAPLAGAYPVGLVDVEQFYGPGLDRPNALPGVSAGYGHRTGAADLWSDKADHFAGAVLLAEILGWCDERVRRQRWGESYFDPAESQQDSERSRRLHATLRDRWGDGVAALFRRSWESATLTDCPPFDAWLAALPAEASDADASASRGRGLSVSSVPATGGQDDDLAYAGLGGAPLGDHGAGAAKGATAVLVTVAKRLEAQGNASGALEVYRAAGEASPSGSPLRQEAALIVGELAGQREAPAPAIIPGDVPALAPTWTESPVPAPILGGRAPVRRGGAVALAAIPVAALASLVLALLLISRYGPATRPVPVVTTPTAVVVAVAAATPSVTPLPPTVAPTPAAIATARPVLVVVAPTVTTAPAAATATSQAAVATIGAIAAAQAATVVANLPPPPTQVVVVVRPAPPAATADTRVALPNIIGRPLDAATQILAQRGFRVARAADQASATAPVGVVTREAPDPGLLLPRGAAIVLTVSSGPPSVPAPDVVGQPLADAQATLAHAGLAVALQQQPSTLPPGLVVSQNPGGGAPAPVGSTVTLFVSATPQVVVPNVVGMPEGQAQAAIQAAGLATTFANHGGHDPATQIGSVESQSPVAGTTVGAGTVVYINVRS